MKSLILLSVLAAVSAQSFGNQNYGNQLAQYRSNGNGFGYGAAGAGNFQGRSYGQGYGSNQKFTGAILSAINSFESHDRAYGGNYQNQNRYSSQNFYRNCPEGQVAQFDGQCVTADVNHNYHLFAAPPQERRNNIQRPIPKPQIRYNHIFVKTPEDANSQPIVIPPPEEKTLVYVLNKDQEEEQQVIQVPSKPHNPEVYYINYDDEDAGYFNGNGNGGYSTAEYSGNYNQYDNQQNYGQYSAGYDQQAYGGSYDQGFNNQQVVNYSNGDDYGRY